MYIIKILLIIKPNFKYNKKQLTQQKVFPVIFFQKNAYKKIKISTAIITFFSKSIKI